MKLFEDRLRSLTFSSKFGILNSVSIDIVYPTL